MCVYMYFCIIYMYAIYVYDIYMCMYDIYGPKSSFGFFHDILRITQKELFASSLSFSLSLSLYIYTVSRSVMSSSLRPHGL